MSFAVELLRSRRVPHVAALALILFACAGCSADTTRFAEDPLSNPFASQREATGSVPTPWAERRAPAPYARPQPHYRSSPMPPVVAVPQSYPTANVGISGGGRGVTSYTPPAPPRFRPAPPKVEPTGSVRRRSVAAVHHQARLKIIVGTSDTLEVLARRYHVTPAAILTANGYRGPRALTPGQQLIIPRPSEVRAAAPAAARRAVAERRAPVIYVVNPGDTLRGIARRYHVSAAALARANNLSPTAEVRAGARLAVPTRTAAASSVAMPRTIAAAPRRATRMAVRQQTAQLAEAAPTAEDRATVTPAKAEATGALPSFQWPVHGRVIASYGAKTNGRVNEGINLAVPDGTPIRAAEAGVVAYAGNELKGYGNLVLLRHPNGYVTAYANASKLLVKRGDKVRRGQVIAKSGETGAVKSPQLHFEIRKGSKPVDPLRLLGRA
ncbi:MAG: peptidoglycan DD-metalloendopeptidase family protein [Bradyrhizobium sp.]